MKRNDRAYYEQPNLWNHAEAKDEERIQRMLQMVPDDVETVVDFGCGAGQFVQELVKTKKTIGFDWSREALKEMAGRAVVGEVQHAPFGNHSFDLVVCSEVLEHLLTVDFEETLKEIVRVARKWLFITVPYEEILEAYFSKCADCGCCYHNHHHVRNFDLTSLLSWFPDFSLVAWEPFGKVEWIGKIEAKIWHGIGGHWVASETGQCPQCGSQRKMEPNRGARDLFGLFLARVIRLFHPATKPRWLLALMKRKTFVP